MNKQEMKRNVEYQEYRTQKANINNDKIELLNSIRKGIMSKMDNETDIARMHKLKNDMSNVNCEIIKLKKSVWSD